jgi:CheY-like chemotaxis protein
LEANIGTADPSTEATNAASLPPARVLIVDDRREVRDGVRALLANEPTLRVVGDAASGDEALGIALVLRPDLIVLDQEMPGSTGLEVLPKLRVILPAARVVMFTMARGISGRADLRGAAAVVAKDAPAELASTLRRLAAARADPVPSAIRRQPRTRGLEWLRAGRSRALVAAAITVLYVAGFFLLQDSFLSQATDAAILVVAAIGALYGLRGGLIAAACALPANAVLIQLVGASIPGTGTVWRGVIAVSIGAACGQLRDLTVRADAQARLLADTSAALEASDSRLLALVEDAPVLLVSIDTAGVIVDALGAGFGDRLRLSPERMRGQQAAVFYADEPQLLDQLGRALSGEAFSERVQRDGATYDVHFRPRYDQSGVLVGTTAVLIDIGPATAP